MDFWDADDIPTTPEAPRFGKPSILEYSPAKFDEILSNFAGILAIMVREARAGPGCIGNWLGDSPEHCCSN